MRNLILSALLLTSAFQTVLGQTYTSGAFTYTVSNNQATITRYSGVGGAVTMPSSVNGIPVVTIGNGYPVFPPYIFYTPNTSVTSISIPSSVTTISSNVFNSCTSLARVTIPDSVRLIGFNAFWGCTGLTTLTIPNSVTSIQSSAFVGCTSLTDVSIPASVTSVQEGAFDGCTSLASVNILGSGTNIEPLTFSGCSSLAIAIVDGGYPSINVPAGTFPDFTLVLSSNSLTALANNPTFVTALATNPAFLSALASSIQAANGNYGIATQSSLNSWYAKFPPSLRVLLPRSIWSK